MRWLGPEQDPLDLMKPFASALIKCDGSKAGSPRKNTPDIIDEIGRRPDDLFDV